MSLYYSTLVHTPALGRIEISPNTLVAVDGHGIITHIVQYDRSSNVSPDAYFRRLHPGATLNYHDFSGPWRFLFPGFVDTHIHASQYPNVGIGSELPLLDWLKNYTFDLEKRFVDDASNNYAFSNEVYRKVIDKTLANGTTCACYFTTIDTNTTKLFADLLLEKGQRGFVGKVCMDCNATCDEYKESVDESVAGTLAVMAHCEQMQEQGGFPANFTVEPIITPRFAPSCSRELMMRLGALAAGGTAVQTHVSENLAEIRLVHDLFPECPSYSAVYDCHGLLTPRTILAHGVHLSADERRLIRERGCSISHCPPSNTFITSGEAPVHQYLHEDGINVCLGTDLSGGYEQSMLGVVKASILVSHHLAMGAAPDVSVSLADALYMATMGGARACGMGSRIGSFAVGKSFDAQLVDIRGAGSNIDVFEFQRPQVGEPEYERKMSQLLQKWVFSGDDRNCCAVWCNGRVVVDKTGSA